MSNYYHKFGEKDIFYNQIKTHPQNEFFIFDCKVYHNKKMAESGAFTGSVLAVSSGFTSLFEMNVDRHPSKTGMIYPYVVKTSDKVSFKNISDQSWQLDYNYGANITSSYPMSASLSREFFASGLTGSSNYTGSALKNTFNYYKIMSPHFAFTGSIALGSDGKRHVMAKGSQRSCLVAIPSIFYGSSIQKGTIDLKFYITGTLVGQLKDERKNGELIQIGPEGSTGSGSVAGVALYNEGFLYLSGAWDLNDRDIAFDEAPILDKPKWIYFGAGISPINSADPPCHGTASLANLSSASFDLNFSGTSFVPNITMMAHAKRGELNHSNNFTYIKFNQTSSLLPKSGSYQWIENNLQIKNVVSSAYEDPTGSFEKTTYITKIGIYDDNKNLIGIASTSKPIKKTLNRGLTFKLKLDI
tara:strand:+ start:1460 stop:2701 length:1242 start_codon:yes stop_codon:yes gene_type:complete